MLQHVGNVREALVDGRLHVRRARLVVLVALGLLVPNRAALRRWERGVCWPSRAMAVAEVDLRPLPLLVVLELHETVHELELHVIIVLRKQLRSVGEYILHVLAALFPPLNFLKVVVELVAFGLDGPLPMRIAFQLRFIGTFA